MIKEFKRIVDMICKQNGPLFILWSLCFMALTITACSRSPYAGAGAYDCEGGDRVILNERLFCVYNEQKQSRPLGEGIDGGVVEMDDSITSLLDPSKYCPLELPNAYVYETLTLCADGDLSLNLLEAIVAQWTLEYAQSETNEMEDETAIDRVDMNITEDEIGVIIGDGGETD